jgi:hypothetical protein
MKKTAFPTPPTEVVPLTPDEFESVPDDSIAAAVRICPLVASPSLFLGPKLVRQSHGLKIPISKVTAVQNGTTSWKVARARLTASIEAYGSIRCAKSNSPMLPRAVLCLRGDASQRHRTAEE